MEAFILGARMSLALIRGDARIEEMEEYVRKVRSMRPDDILAHVITGTLLAKCYIAKRRYNEAELFLREARALSQQKGEDVYTAGTLTSLAQIAFFRGQLHRAEEMLKQALGMARFNENTTLIHMLSGMVYHYWNDLEEADAEREKALASFSTPSEMGSIYLYTTRVYLLQGDIESAAEAIEKAEGTLVTEDTTTEDLARVAAYRLALALEQDDREAISRWLDKFTDYEVPFLYDVLNNARHLLYERLGEVWQERLKTEYENYYKEGYQLLEMGIRLHQALLSTDPDEALTFITEVLAIAKPEGNIRIFADFGIPLAPLLRRAIAAGIEPEFTRKILKIIENEERQRQIRKGEIPPATRLLTEREMEVLSLMADGLSNPQIARRLVISLDTAKTHVHHILDKLEVTSRIQAIARARDLNLL
ncbi:MAG: LuxR C-terminal-related transcriptional regulator [Dehalococcoidia bacterium]|jgi:LuxR family maltose regulon positive regulatory protein